MAVASLRLRASLFLLTADGAAAGLIRVWLARAAALLLHNLAKVLPPQTACATSAAPPQAEPTGLRCDSAAGARVSGDAKPRLCFPPADGPPREQPPRVTPALHGGVAAIRALRARD